MRLLFASLALFATHSAFADTAAAVTTTNAKNSILGPIGLMVIFVLAFYFLAIRPQMKRTKEHRNLLGQLSNGDEVITTGGIVGKVANISDSFVELTIAENVTVKVQKPAIATVVPKGSLKAE